MVSGTSFGLPDAVPPGAYLVRLHLRFNGKGGHQLGALGISGTVWPPGMVEDEAREMWRAAVASSPWYVHSSVGICS